MCRGRLRRVRNFKDDRQILGLGVAEASGGSAFSETTPVERKMHPAEHFVGKPNFFCRPAGTYHVSGTRDPERITRRL